MGYKKRSRTHHFKKIYHQYLTSTVDKKAGLGFYLKHAISMTNTHKTVNIPIM